MKKYGIISRLCRLVAVMVLLVSVCVPDAAAALDASYYAGSSALSSGRWVKVKVRGSGIHQVTDAELAAMGFGDPSKVAVYGYGASLLYDHRLTSDTPDDLPAVPVLRAEGKILFYGEGDVSLTAVPAATGDVLVGVPQRNYYCDYSTYFLTDSRAPSAPVRVELPPQTANTVTESYGVLHLEEELTNPGEIGAPFLGADFSKTQSQELHFSMPSYQPGTAAGRKSISVALQMAMQSANSNQLRITLPSGERRTVYVSQTMADAFAYANCSHSYTDVPAASADGSYSVVLDASALSLNYAAVDYLTVAYPRSNRLNGVAEETLVFRRLGDRDRIELTNAAESTVVWDITDRFAPRALEFEEGEPDASGERRVYVASPGLFDIPAGSACVSLVAFDPAGEFPGVEPVGEVPSQDLHALTTPRMLVVASAPFLEEAERLAEAHRRIEGKDVLVIDQQKVFNEFSSGTPHVMAIRRFARMLYDRNPGALKSVLLFGPASYDNRGLTSMLDRDTFHDTYIPIYQREDLSGAGKTAESYSTDAVAGMLGEDTDAFDIGRSLMTVAVGRVPAADVTAARSYVDKAVGLLNHPPAGDYRNRALLMCDDGDSNGHMADANGAAEAIAACSPATTVYKAYNTIYPFENGRALQLNRVASQALSKGVAYWAYSGHATPRFFGSEQIWSITRSNEETYDVKPFVMLATCRALHYDHVGENIGEAMLYNGKGGAIALVGALRSVYKEYNQLLNVEMAREFYSAPAGTTYGEIFLNARNRLVPVSGSPATDPRFYDVIYNTLSYNYIGDPELTPAQPAQQVRVTAVNGAELLSGKLTEISAGGKLTVAGEVLNAEGETDTAFDGTVSLSLFDGAKTVHVINVDASSSTEDTVVLDEDVLVERRARVTGGKFSVSFHVPEPMRCGGVNRLTLYAQASDDPSRQASGVTASLSIVERDGASEVPGEESAPVISAMYLDGEEFRDGDTFTSAPVLHAEVAPNEMGVTGLSSRLGKSVMLFLDGKHVFATASGYFTPDVDGGGTIELPLSEISDGRHVLTLRVSNNAGQMTSRTISFVMVNVHSSAEILVDAAEPVSDEVTFSLAGWEYDAPEARVTVKDGAGNAVFTDAAASFPYVWNLRDASGNAVPEGPYTVEAYMKGGQRYGTAASAPFTVIR